MPQSAAACDECRKRKVRCDRLKPCSNCKQHDKTCITSHDGARPRGRLGGRKGNRESIQARLARLEGLLGSLEAKTEHQLHTPESTGEPLELETSNGLQTKQDSDKLHRYVAGPIWAQLSEQIEGLRDMLQPSSDEEDDTLQLSPIPRQGHLLLGGPLNYTHSLFQHPPSAIRETLHTVFVDNLDLVFNISHRPTTVDRLRTVGALETNTPQAAAIHAFCFAIYASALMTLEDDERIAIVGPTHEKTAHHFLCATEYFLSKCDYLNSKDLVAFQTFLLYLMVVRRNDSGQKHWVLLGLAVQLARGLGLHSAATTNTFKPLQRELRLRSWQALRNLDVRAALDWGVDPIIRLDSYDVPNPTNLNDDDLNDDMLVMPPPRVGISDSTFGIIPDLGTVVAAKLQYLDVSDVSADSNIWAHRLALVEEYETKMNTQYLRHCDLCNPMQWMMTYVAHALSRFCRLLVVRPMSRLGDKTILPSMNSQEVFDRAIESLRAEELFYQTSLVKGFHWCTWNQWYCLAVALVEVCAMPSLCQDDDTWAVLEQAYRRESTSIAETSRGRLWKPMKKLMKRVQGLRESQLILPQTVNNLITHAHNDYPPEFHGMNAEILSSGQQALNADFQSPNSHTFLNLEPDLSVSLSQIDNSMAFWDDFLLDMNSLSPSEIQNWSV